jgi:hypothetical protein
VAVVSECHVQTSKSDKDEDEEALSGGKAAENELHETLQLGVAEEKDDDPGGIQIGEADINDDDQEAVNGNVITESESHVAEEKEHL